MGTPAFKYINRIRPHDADVKRRQYALERAAKIDGMRQQFVDWALKNGKTSAEIEEGLQQIDELKNVWIDVADQNKID